MKPVLIRFDLVMLTQLRVLADAEGVSVACIVRSIIEDWFKKRAASIPASR